MNILLTGACGVTPRAAARSLRMSQAFGDSRLIGTDLCNNSYGIYEGLYDCIYRVPAVTDPEYSNAIAAICARESIDAALIMPEVEVLFWASREFPVPVLLPPSRFCHIAVSKKRLYEALEGTGLVPKFRITTREELLSSTGSMTFPCWIRDFGDGSTSGKGALLSENSAQAAAWATLNPTIPSFMCSEYLPGRNYACHLLYDHGEIVKTASYERLEYFMARTVISGVSGNISRGRLVSDPRLVAVSDQAVREITTSTGETMHGLVAVDLREDMNGSPLVTEINLRHVAATSSFAQAGFNMVEAHLKLTLGERSTLGPISTTFPPNNMILRDIDGTPIWVSNFATTKSLSWDQR